MRDLTPGEFVHLWADWIPSHLKRKFLEDAWEVSDAARARERRRLTTDLIAFWNARDVTLDEIKREGGRVL